MAETIKIEVAGEVWKPRMRGFWARLFGGRERRIDTFAASWSAPGPAVMRALEHQSGVRLRVNLYASGRAKVTLWWRGEEVLDWEDSWVRIADEPLSIPFEATVGVRIQGTVTLRSAGSGGG